MQAQREGVVGVERRQHSHVVSASPKLSGERLDVARHTAGVGPRVRRNERDPHGITLYRPKLPSRLARRKRVP
jgi:hypothetical protein